MRNLPANSACDCSQGKNETKKPRTQRNSIVLAVRDSKKTLVVMSMSEKEFLSKEASLRSRLLQKPKSAKIMSQLASLMADHGKAIDDVTLRSEAIQLSKRAIQTAPHKPFGYAALSSASQDYNERIGALDKAY